MRASKAPPRDAAGTGHLCSTANSVDSGMQSPGKRGLQHVLAPAGRCSPDPRAQQAAKPSLGLNTRPTTGAAAGQGLLARTGSCPSVLRAEGLAQAWEKQGWPWSSTRGEERGSKHLRLLLLLLWQRCLGLREEPAASPQGLEGKQKLQLKISSRPSCAFTSASLTSFHPTAVAAFGGVGRPSEKHPGVGSPLFSSLRLSLFLTPCLQPDVLAASLLPASALTLVFIQQFNSGS